MQQQPQFSSLQALAGPAEQKEDDNVAKLTDAGHIDLKERRFRQLIEAGVFKRPKTPVGWDLDEVRIAYIRYLRAAWAVRASAIS